MDLRRGGFRERANRGRRDTNPMVSHSTAGFPQKVKAENVKSFSDGTLAGSGHTGRAGELEGTRKAPGIEEGAQGMSVSEAFAAEAGVGEDGQAGHLERAAEVGISEAQGTALVVGDKDAH